MKNTIDDMFLSTSTAAKGLDGIASIASPEADSDVQGFETTFRQALAAIDGVRSGKNLPKELLEFDAEKIAGMVLKEKKLSSDSSVLIGDADLSNQTVIAFAALQGMDADSLKTLFEKPVSEKEMLPQVASADRTISTSDLSDDFVEMPPGSVELTVRALEEQGLLPQLQGVGSKEKLSSEYVSGNEKELIKNINLPGDVDIGTPNSEAEPVSSKSGAQGEIMTNSWLNLRAREDVSNPAEIRGDASRKSTDLPHINTKVDSVDSNSDLADRESLVIGKNSAVVSSSKDSAVVSSSKDSAVVSSSKDSAVVPSNKEFTPDRSTLGGERGSAKAIKTSELDMAEADQKKLHTPSAVNVNASAGQGTVSKKQIEITSGLINSPGSHQEKDKQIAASEKSIEFEEILPSKDKSGPKAKPLGLQTTKTINEAPPQSQYINSIGPVKPLTQQAHLTGSVQLGEVAALESALSSSDLNTTQDTLTQPKALSARITVDDLPGKLTALVQQRIINGLKVEGWRYQVHLHPEELGSVEIQMEMMDGRLEARILASNVAARDLLNEHLARLEESLQNGGIKESMVQVGLEQRQDSKKSFDSGDDNQETQTELADGDESATEDARQSNDGELDLFV